MRHTVRMHSYYLILDESDHVLGRHHWLYPDMPPPDTVRNFLRRWYPGHKARLIRDPDQESTATGIYVKRDRYAYERKRRETLRKLLRDSSAAELIEVIRQLDPSAP